MLYEVITDRHGADHDGPESDFGSAGLRASDPDKVIQRSKLQLPSVTFPTRIADAAENMPIRHNFV